MKSRSRMTALGGVAISALIAATGCGTSAEEGGESRPTLTGTALHSQAQKEGALSFYCSAAPDTCEAIAAGFTEETGVKTTVLRSTSPDAAARYGSEKKSRAKTADVLLNSEYSFYATGLDEGILTTFEEAGYLPEGYPREWLVEGEGVRGLPFISEALGIGINTDKVSETERPASWTDLGDEQWAGKMNGPASGNASFSTLYGTLDANVGGLIDGLKTQRIFGDKGGMVSLTESLSSGEYSLQTLASEIIVTDAQEGGAPVDFVIPEEGMTGPAFTFLLNDSPERPHAQKAFAEYVTSTTLSEDLAEVSDYILAAHSDPDYTYIPPEFTYYTEKGEQEIVDRMAGK